MTAKNLILTSAILPFMLSSCGVLPAGPPERAENRAVTITSSSSRTLTLKEPMVFANSPNMRVNGKGVRLPSGAYRLEAEDAHYFYFRAPSAPEYRVIIQGKADQMFIPGGVALPKSSFAPAATYADFKVPGIRQITRMLGTEFLLEEGRKWTRTP
jgi:hypothetical protein